MMRNTRTSSPVVALLVADRRRQLNLLNQRALTPQAQLAGVGLVVTIAVLILTITVIASFHAGERYPVLDESAPTIYAVSWFFFVLLILVASASIDPVGARNIKEPSDVVVLAAFGVTRTDLLWCRLLIPCVLQATIPLIVATAVMVPWFSASEAGREIYPPLLFIFIITTVFCQTIGLLITLLFVIYGHSSVVSKKRLLTITLLSLALGTFFAPIAKRYAEETDLVETGYAVLGDILLSSRPGWWQELADGLPAWSVVLSMVCTALLMIVATGTIRHLMRDETWNQLRPGLEYDQTTATVSGRILCSVLSTVGKRRNPAIRLLASLVIKDLVAVVRHDKLALRSAHLVFLGGISIFFLGLGAAASNGGDIPFSAPILVSAGLITAFVILASDAAVHIASIEAERKNWQVLLVTRNSRLQIHTAKLCAFSTVVLVLSSPGVVGILLLTTPDPQSKIFLLLVSFIICLLAGLSSIIVSKLVSRSEARSMRNVERSAIADLAQPTFIALGSSLVLLSVPLATGPTARSLIALLVLLIALGTIGVIGFQPGKVRTRHAQPE